MIHFANTFNALALNDTEVGLFSAIVLLTADRPGVTDIKSIEHHKDKLIEALKVQVSTTKPKKGFPYKLLNKINAYLTKFYHWIISSCLGQIVFCLERY